MSACGIKPRFRCADGTQHVQPVGPAHVTGSDVERVNLRPDSGSLANHPCPATRHLSVAWYFAGGRKSSATGTRARVAWVRAEYPDQLDYSGLWHDLTGKGNSQLLLWLM